ncbi:MAG: nitroreductase family protein [Deltaproteobacteria bacterium]|nr:nitroreductase family protein [Deltaproteobacteria bacterium]
MDVFEAIRTRRSCRSFVPGLRIERRVLEDLFSLAVLAPSSFNLQPWRFLVVEDERMRARIRPIAKDQAQITDSSALIVVCAHERPAEVAPDAFARRVESGQWTPERRERALRAVDQLYPDDLARREYAIRNSTLAAAHILLAAEGFGLTTCPIIGFDKPVLTTMLGVMPPWVISFLIAIGTRAKEEPARPPRHELARVVFYETLK